MKASFKKYLKESMEFKSEKRFLTFGDTSAMRETRWQTSFCTLLNFRLNFLAKAPSRRRFDLAPAPNGHGGTRRNFHFELLTALHYSIRRE